MESISRSDSMPIRVARDASSNGSFIEQKAKSKGVPANVIAQGPTAIKAWAQEHGKIPASTSKEPNSVANQSNSNPQIKRSNSSAELVRDLEADEASYDRFGQTPGGNIESTKVLSDSRNFKLDIMA